MDAELIDRRVVRFAGLQLRMLECKAIPDALQVQFSQIPEPSAAMLLLAALAALALKGARAL